MVKVNKNGVNLDFESELWRAADVLRSNMDADEYTHPRLDTLRLGQLIDLVGRISLGYDANRSKDILVHVYEYFPSQFASAEGKKGGQFHTPRSAVNVLVEILAPYKGRVIDPCCGSGVVFVESSRFVPTQVMAAGRSHPIGGFIQ